MKKLRFFVVLVFIAVLATSLYACGKGNGGANVPTENNTHEHSYGEWVGKTAATCITDRVERRTCIYCGDEETRIVPDTATGIHVYNESNKCIYCGKDKPEEGAHQHTFGEWSVKSAATCVDDRTEKRVCSQCNFEETRKVENTALGHNVTTFAAKEPTCTEIGWAAYETCSRCDYTTYVEKKALGHKLVHHDGKEATCTEDGWAEYDTCSRCDYSTYDKKEALGHNCDENDVCTRCGSNQISQMLTFKYYYNLGGYVISDYTGSATKVKLPSSYNDGINGEKPVKRIGYGTFKNNISLTSVIIPDSVTSIGDYAFSGCSGLISIKIPDSVGVLSKIVADLRVLRWVTAWKVSGKKRSRIVAD